MKCSDCKRWRTSECYLNPQAVDFDNAEQFTCFKQKSGESPLSQDAEHEISKLDEAALEIAKNVKVKKKARNKGLLVLLAMIVVAAIVLPVAVMSNNSDTTQQQISNTPIYTYPTYHYESSSSIYSNQEYCNIGWHSDELYQTLRHETMDRLRLYLCGDIECSNEPVSSASLTGEEIMELLTGENFKAPLEQCANLSVGIWEALYYKYGISSVIVVGNLEMNNETLDQCDYVWLRVCSKDYSADTLGCYYIDSTTADIYGAGVSEQYYEGYYYTSPDTLMADTAGRWPY